MGSIKRRWLIIAVLAATAASLQLVNALITGSIISALAAAAFAFAVPFAFNNYRLFDTRLKTALQNIQTEDEEQHE